MEASSHPHRKTWARHLLPPPESLPPLESLPQWGLGQWTVFISETEEFTTIRLKIYRQLRQCCDDCTRFQLDSHHWLSASPWQEHQWYHWWFADGFRAARNGWASEAVTIMSNCLWERTLLSTDTTVVFQTMPKSFCSPYQLLSAWYLDEGKVKKHDKVLPTTHRKTSWIVITILYI